jgi:ribosomal protein S18 acetylase RimI-like enzyme
VSPEAAPLTLEAVPSLETVVGDRDTALRGVEACYLAERTEFAHRFGLIAEEEGAVVGIAIAFPGRLYSSLKLGTGVVLARTVGARHVVELAARARVLNRLLPAVDRRFLYLSILSVSEERRGSGVGSALLERVISGAGRIGLGVATDTAADERARDLYERSGFRVTSLRETTEDERRTVPVAGMVRMERPAPR